MRSDGSVRGGTKDNKKIIFRRRKSRSKAKKVVAYFAHLLASVVT